MSHELRSDKKLRYSQWDRRPGDALCLRLPQSLSRLLPAGNLGFRIWAAFTEETEAYLLELLKPDYINGLTLLGGDPFEAENQRTLLPFLRRVKKTYPGKDIWAYTGYTWEQLTSGAHRVSIPETVDMLQQIDTLVDGPFILAKKNIRLRFRGSENQRIINVRRSFETQQIILWEWSK